MLRRSSVFKLLISGHLELNAVIFRRATSDFIFNSTIAKELRNKKLYRKSEFLADKTEPHIITKLTEELPVFLKYLKGAENKVNESSGCQNEQIVCKINDRSDTVVPYFPYQANSEIQENSETSHSIPEDPRKNPLEVIRLRNKFVKEHKNWMLSYDNFEDTSVEGTSSDDSISYGTPIPKSNITKVPCGGCGAYLHCKDPALPGYLPSEILNNCYREGASDLSAMICQRCYFLKNHNIALEVQVSPEDYPKVLKTISLKQQAVIILMVDLSDFPCSIWPGIADIFHKMPIIVVGNKVDVLPRDSPKYLDNVKRKLVDTIKAHGFGSLKIIDTILVSAVTGYGIEKLITSLHKSWRFKGDVYLVGCTNVGKSSLFNALIKSDYCKSQAEDLIQRATTSVWPGTTLNLLKFPIAKPGGLKLKVRTRRLRDLERLERHEKELNVKSFQRTKDLRHTLLTGRVNRSMPNFEDDEEMADVFSVNISNRATGRFKLGVNEKDPLYAFGRWCYDTPGVVQPDQILHLLTAEELFLTLSKTLIEPKTFIIYPGQSLFIAGLARLDFINGENSTRLTVFCSKDLPISMCSTEAAERLYKEYLGTKYMKVPFGDEERLKKWSGLAEAKQFSVRGVDFDFSAKDVVLSNAGWISITGRTNEIYEFIAWTPEKRGVYLRDSILPQAVKLKGKRMPYGPAYYYSNNSFEEEETEFIGTN